MYLLFIADYEIYWIKHRMIRFHGAIGPNGPGPPHYRGLMTTLRHTPHSIGLLWTSDQPDAGSSTRQPTTLTTDRHPCLRRNSDPQTPQKWPTMYRTVIVRTVHQRAAEQLSRYSYWLRSWRAGDRIQVEAGFSAPVQTGRGAHPASCKVGTGSFTGVKRPGRGVDHPLPI